MNHEKLTLIFKALSDSNRLKIIEMLSCSCDDMCACHILENFDITQPTLSHHMKTLIDAGIINVKKEGSFNYYSINKDKISEINEFLKNISTDKACCCGCKNE